MPGWHRRLLPAKCQSEWPPSLFRPSYSWWGYHYRYSLRCRFAQTWGEPNNMLSWRAIIMGEEGLLWMERCNGGWGVCLLAAFLGHWPRGMGITIFNILLWSFCGQLYVVERMSHVEAGKYSPAACGSLLVTPTGARRHCRHCLQRWLFCGIPLILLGSYCR